VQMRVSRPARELADGLLDSDIRGQESAASPQCTTWIRPGLFPHTSLNYLIPMDFYACSDGAVAASGTTSAERTAPAGADRADESVIGRSVASPIRRRDLPPVPATVWRRRLAARRRAHVGVRRRGKCRDSIAPPAEAHLCPDRKGNGATGLTRLYGR
jgi:hypothetical protein